MGRRRDSSKQREMKKCTTIGIGNRSDFFFIFFSATLPREFVVVLEVLGSVVRRDACRIDDLVQKLARRVHEHEF